MESFFTILTNLGRATEAEAMGTGIPVILAEMALGDGLDGVYYEPDPEQTELKNELWRGNLYSLRHDPDNPYQYIAEVIVPADAPHFFVREAGLYTDDGVLYAVAKHPVVEKPQLLAGVDFRLHIQLIFTVSNADSVQIVVDPDEDITIDDALVPSGDTGTPAVLFCWLAHMMKSISGQVSWRTPPITSLEALHAVLPQGTRMPFIQAAPPPAFDLDPSNYSDRALRVVSANGGGIGGTDDFSLPPDMPSLEHGHSLAGHTHTDPATPGHQLIVDEMPDHGHTTPLNYQVNQDEQSGAPGGTGAPQNPGTPYTIESSHVGGNQAHPHPSGGQTGSPSVNFTDGWNLVAPTIPKFTPKFIDCVIGVRKAV